MEAVAGLLLVLFGVSHGVETHCDGRQNGAQCYGALGGTVDIQLMSSTSETPRYQLLKNSLKILDVRNNKVISNTIKHGSVFPSNGTFRINNLSRNDGGNYSLETFDSDGIRSGMQILQLFIQAPVPSALLVSECLSQGEKSVSCSSEGGDSPQYSWTLDGRTLTDAELLSGNSESNIITLKQHVSGHLVCSVRNNISNVSKELMISTCGFIFIKCTSINGTQISGWAYKANNSLCIELTTQPTTTQTAVDKETGTVSIKISTNITSLNPSVSTDDPQYISNLLLIGGLLSAVMIFLVVCVAVVCAQRRKKNDKLAKQKDEEVDQEVTYTNVRVTQRQGKQEEHTVEAEAEGKYGQIKFSKQPQHTEPTEDVHQCPQSQAT